MLMTLLELKGLNLHYRICLISHLTLTNTYACYLKSAPCKMVQNNSGNLWKLKRYQRHTFFGQDWIDVAT